MLIKCFYKFYEEVENISSICINLVYRSDYFIEGGIYR